MKATGILAATLLLAALFTVSPRASLAEFFSNGKGTTKQLASADALESLGQTLLAAANLERGDGKAANEQLDKAKSVLSAAVAEFATMSRQGDFANQPVDFSKLTDADRENWKAYVGEEPPNAAAVFALTGNKLGALLGKIETFQKSPDTANYRALKEQLIQVLEAGDLSTKLLHTQ